MLEFFEGLSVIGKVYWTTALIGSALLVVILIMTLMGGDMDGDMEADGTDFDADDGGVGFQLVWASEEFRHDNVGISCINFGDIHRFK